MPQINRIRIINFSYNNHNRHIIDETFDFYQGENALLSLKNGGGKSVLVQLLLQPIIPKTRLMNRRIEDFFAGRKTPSYILIEWKLEDQGGYLLTGIALSNRETQVREQDEASNSLKYFTFTSDYRQSNLYNIENIPLVKKQDERIYIEDYKTVQKLIEIREKDTNFRVRLFTDEDRLEYRKHLSSYNISQDEWRSIILKINESEGGVIEIFEKCKTSQQLMNDWILKSIEKVVNKEDRDQKKLEQMLENLVEEMIKNEQFIYEKEVYQQFLKESNEFIAILNRLVDALDMERNIEKQISRMYYHLKSEINKMTIENNVQIENIVNSEKELERIDLEERSKEYYDLLDKLKGFKRLWEEGKQCLEEIDTEMDKNKKEILVQQAARDYGYIRGIKTQLAGIQEDIEKIKSSSENKEKVRNLEYSLKIAYEKMLERLRKEAADVESRIRDKTEAVHKQEERRKELEKAGNDWRDKRSRAQADIDRFMKDERKLKEELQLTYTRNLLGEMEEAYKTGYLKKLNDTVSSLKAEKACISRDTGSAQERIRSIDGEITTLRKRHDANIIEKTKLSNNIEEYDRTEASIEAIFDRYDLEWSRRFDHEQNQIFLKARINELQKRERELDLNVRTIGEDIVSLKNGTLHVSKEFSELLIQKDIAFETGENYLRKQNADIRNELVKGNPILPFAYLLYNEDIESLKEMNIGLHIHQMVPILSYSDINQPYTIKNNLVKVEDKLWFFCLFDSKMFDADNLDIYLKELEEKRNALHHQFAHYRRELERAGEDIHQLKQFDYHKNYRYELEKDKEKIEEEIETLNNQMHVLENEKTELSARIDEYNRRVNAIEKESDRIEKNIEKFKEFIEEDERYIRNRQASRSYSEAIEKIEEEKKSLEAYGRKLNDEKEKLSEQKFQINNKIKSAEDRLLLYRDAADGVYMEEAVEDMEARLQALKYNITFNLERLEIEYRNKLEELKDKQYVLRSYLLEESQYIHTTYDKGKLHALQQKMKDQEEDRRQIDQKHREINSNLKITQGHLESVEKEVKKLAESPIERSLIKLNFTARKKEEKEKIVGAKKRIADLDIIAKECERITSKIEIQVDIHRYEVDSRYKVAKSIEEDYKNLTRDLKYAQKENKKYEDNADSHYYKIRADYQNKNKHIENIFTGLDPLMEGAKNDRNKYYYLGERILINNESLNKLIRACEQRLANVEKNKKDMIQHSYLHGKQVYDEIQKIAENSSIRLEGKSRPIPMLRIKMAPLEETEEENITKMMGYIENCIHIIKEDMKENKRIEEIRKKISKYMSTSELLNVLSDLGRMSVDAYKIDINVKNSGYKTWEQVMKENSGGERFVSFFSVLVALMSYTRTSIKFEDDYERNKDTKVLIMDNPFGPISSEHLLKPLFEIARKYNTQLICMTDLKQNSILNCFDLIYMIKIRQNVFGTNEFIQLEQQIKAAAVVEKDEMLEKAVFKAEDAQMSLF